MTTDVVIDMSSTRGSLGLCLEILPSGIVWYTFLICVERVFSYKKFLFYKDFVLNFNSLVEAIFITLLHPTFYNESKSSI